MKLMRKICNNVLIAILLTAFSSIIISEPVYAFQMQSNSKIEINSINKNMIVGERQALNTILLSDDKVIGSVKHNVTYQSSNINVIKIENNQLIAVNKGISYITATYNNKKANVVIYVEEKKKSKEDSKKYNLEVKLQWSRKKTELVLEWSKVDGLSNFKVLKKLLNESEYKEIEKHGVGNRFIDNDIVPDCEYSYRVILNDKYNNNYNLNDFTIPKYITQNEQPLKTNTQKVNSKQIKKHDNYNNRVIKPSGIILPSNNKNTKNNKKNISKDNFSNKTKTVVEKKEKFISKTSYDNLYGVGEPIILEKGLLKQVNGKVTLNYYYSEKANVTDANLVLYNIGKDGGMTEVKDALLDISKKTIAFTLKKDGIYCIEEKGYFKKENIIKKDNSLTETFINKSLQKPLKTNKVDSKKIKLNKKEKKSKVNVEKNSKISDLNLKNKTNNSNNKKEKIIKDLNIKVDKSKNNRNVLLNSSNKKAVKLENNPKKDIELSKQKLILHNNKGSKNKESFIKSKENQKDIITEKESLKETKEVITNNEVLNKKNLNDKKTSKKDSNVVNENINKKINTELLAKQEKNLTKNRCRRSVDAFSLGTTAYMGTSASVYSGPNSYYAVIGSVDSGEQVSAIASEWGWIYIEYRTNNGLKRGYVTKSQLKDFDYIYDKVLKEDYFTGYAGSVRQNTTVLSGPGYNYRDVGTIFLGEGLTVFSNSRHLNEGYAYVEFSTPSSTKRGYIQTSLLTAKRRGTLASVEKDTKTFAAPKATAAKLGSVDYHELVVILTENSNWQYLEYNTKIGRKRGYSYTKTFKKRNFGYCTALTDVPKIGQSKKDMPVYTGPNSNYAKMGSINSQEKVRVFLNCSEDGYSYVEYGSRSGLKRGYVPSNDINLIGSLELPPIKTITAKKVWYGKSGLGRDLYHYEIGRGRKALVAVFAIHGFEDAWASDGLELYKIAQRTITDLERLGDLSGWTTYIIPTANPDALIDGFTNDGPGRCTVKHEMDLNRCFPTRYQSFHGQGSRNNNGTRSLVPPEAKYLHDFIELAKRNHDSTVLLDVHGWENNTIGNNEIGKYFGEQFGFGHNPSSGGSGYLISWGNANGIKSTLVELPWPNSPQDIINRDFAGKVSRAIQNICKRNPSVNSINAKTQMFKQAKLGKVKVSSYLNVRNAADKNSNIIGRLEKNQLVNLFGENGNWFKISNGYIYKDFVEIIQSNSISEKTFKVPLKGKVINVTTSLNIRNGAGKQCASIGSLKANQIVEIIGEKENWYKINSGYVSKDYIQIINSSPINNTNQNSNEKPIKDEKTSTIDVTKKIVSGFCNGFWEAAKESAEGSFDFILHPIKTLKDTAQGVKFFAKALDKNSDERKAIEQMAKKFIDEFKSDDIEKNSEKIGKIVGQILIGALFDQGPQAILAILKDVQQFKKVTGFIKKLKKGKVEHSELREAFGACFTGDTLIHTEYGLKPIKNIKIGDKVYSENIYTKEVSLKEVKNTFVKDSNKLIYIHLKNDIIKATENHPFYVENKGWISAGTLTENDKLRCSDGTILNINKIEIKFLANSIKVYNFEVDDWHNYFVCKNKVLVHNSCSNTELNNLNSIVRDISKLKNTENFRKRSLNHIFEGELSGLNRDKAVGFHYEGIPNSKAHIISETKTPLDKFGIYNAKITINGIEKIGFSTFFPQNYTPQEIVNLINEAFSSKKFVKGNTFIGKTSVGFRIKMFIDDSGKIISAFPEYLKR